MAGNRKLFYQQNFSFGNKWLFYFRPKRFDQVLLLRYCKKENEN